MAPSLPITDEPTFEHPVTTQLVLNLERVSSVDNAGLGAIIEAVTVARQKAVRLTLVNPTERHAPAARGHRIGKDRRDVRLGSGGARQLRDG